MVAVLIVTQLSKDPVGSSPTLPTIYEEIGKWLKPIDCKSIFRGFESHSLLHKP